MEISLDKHEVDAIHDLLDEGQPHSLIAANFGISETRVCEMAKSLAEHRQRQVAGHGDEAIRKSPVDTEASLRHRLVRFMKSEYPSLDPRGWLVSELVEEMAFERSTTELAKRDEVVKALQSVAAVGAQGGWLHSAQGDDGTRWQWIPFGVKPRVVDEESDTQSDNDLPAEIPDVAADLPKKKPRRITTRAESKIRRAAVVGWLKANIGRQYSAKGICLNLDGDWVNAKRVRRILRGLHGSVVDGGVITRKKDDDGYLWSWRLASADESKISGPRNMDAESPLENIGEVSEMLIAMGCDPDLNEGVVISVGDAIRFAILLNRDLAEKSAASQKANSDRYDRLKKMAEKVGLTPRPPRPEEKT